ncbi:unnamed protein product [Rodentolepis nana]|uniref:Uncharacterized protein n=1 Tax=Rodentolepis nana TaxID=102285 RepID=A0A0R3TC57_RODNA|nr:unnamed protein product [Rodentolepis nana]
MRTPVCCLVCDDFLAIRCRRVPTPTADDRTPRCRHCLGLVINYFILGLVFLILTAILLAFELASGTPLRIGYWNGALAAISALAMFCVAAYPTHWTLVFLLISNAFTILACAIVALTTVHDENRQIPSYWICLTILALSVYSAIFVLAKRGLPWSNIREVESDFILPSLEQSGMQELQPPEGFVLPGEHLLPDYDSLRHPPTYGEAMGEGHSEDQTNTAKSKNKR